MKILASRRDRTPSQFQRAAEGSMTLMEHLRELRSRLFKACVAILLGFIAGWFLAVPVLEYLQEPYCSMMADRAITDNGGTLPADWTCPFVQLGVPDVLILRMKIALWVGLIIAAPYWLYQLWAFVAPGLHRHERRWAYIFGGIAGPLFALGAYLAFLVVSHGLVFLLQFTGPEITTTLEITRYVDFVTGMMLIFGLAFEFPLGVMLANIAGIVTGKRLLSWWRVAVFVAFLFSAIATPTADPFGMSFLALALSALYFGAVGFAIFNDRRRARNQPSYAGLSDDEASPLDYAPDSLDGLEPVGAPEPIAPPEPVEPPRALDRRYDDAT